jgi:3-dehydroquinate synthase
MNNIFYTGQEIDFLSLIESKKYESIYILVDAHTNECCLPVFKNVFPSFENVSSIIIPAGEVNKSIEIVQLIWNEMLTLSITRNSLIINLGGGVLTDMGSFAASTYKRGIDFLNIPTTLLAMVDASVGGKTGFNFQGVKNCIGTFQTSIATYINPIFLNTLSKRHLLNGSVEMIKHALLQSEIIWNEAKNYSLIELISIDKIKQSIAIKQQIVIQDFSDNGIRQCLNIGHTIGHAIESYSYQTTFPLLHGEAIMLGLIHEQIIAESVLNTDSIIRKELIAIKERLFPDLNFTYSIDNILPYLLQDKKNSTYIKMSLLPSIANCKIQTVVSLDELKKSFSNL